MCWTGEYPWSIARVMVSITPSILRWNDECQETKMMTLNGEVKDELIIRGDKIDVEKSFTYLGANIKAEEAYAAEEVATRISRLGNCSRIISSTMEMEANFNCNEDSNISRSDTPCLALW